MAIRRRYNSLILDGALTWEDFQSISLAPGFWKECFGSMERNLTRRLSHLQVLRDYASGKELTKDEIVLLGTAIIENPELFASMQGLPHDL